MKYTKAMREQMLDTLRKTPIIETMCQKLGVSKMTFSRWRRRYSGFNKQVEEALMDGRSRMNDVAENVILGGLLQDDMSAAKFYLNHNSPRYASKLELSGSIAAKDESLTKEQKALLRKAFKNSSLYEKAKKDK